MTDDLHRAIFGDELFQKFEKSSFLGVGPCISGVTVFIIAANVTHPDRVIIPAVAVSAHFGDLTARFHGTVEANHEVVADTAKTTFAVPAVNFLGRDVAAFRGRGAVDYDFIDLSHI